MYIYIIYMIIYVFMAAAKNVRRRTHTPKRRCLVLRFIRYPYISKGYDPHVLSNMYTLWVMSHKYSPLTRNMYNEFPLHWGKYVPQWLCLT